MSPRRKPLDVVSRQAEIRRFIELHGRGEDARTLWNREHRGTDQTYATRQSWFAAANRALDSPARRMQKAIEAAHAEAVEWGETSVEIAIEDLLAAAEG